jgi:hypothetical protein
VPSWKGPNATVVVYRFEGVGRPHQQPLTVTPEMIATARSREREGIGLPPGRKAPHQEPLPPPGPVDSTRDVVKRMIDGSGDQLKPCLRGQAAQLILHFVVTPDGAVAGPAVDAPGVPVAALTCLVGKLRAWRFPPPAFGKPVEIVHPFAVEAQEI